MKVRPTRRWFRGQLLSVCTAVALIVPLMAGDAMGQSRKALLSDPFSEAGNAAGAAAQREFLARAKAQAILLYGQGTPRYYAALRESLAEAAASTSNPDGARSLPKVR